MSSLGDAISAAARRSEGGVDRGVAEQRALRFERGNAASERDDR